jgi:ribonuclease P protein component
MRRSDFRRPVTRDGRRASAGPLVLHVLTGSGDGPGPRPGGSGTGVRVGLAVGRAVGGAVVRNRVRRRLREAAAVALPVAGRPSDGSPAHETLVLVRARPGVEVLGVPDLAALVSRAWRRVDAPRGDRS